MPIKKISKHSFPIILDFRRSNLCERQMKVIAVIAFALLATLAAAEKYAMVFGTANGWDNYSISSVGFVFAFNSRILAVCTQISFVQA